MDDPWRVLVICMLLNVTNGRQVIVMISSQLLLSEWRKANFDLRSCLGSTYLQALKVSVRHLIPFAKPPRPHCICWQMYIIGNETSNQSPHIPFLIPFFLKS